MKVDWAVPCRYAETPGDGTATMLGAGIDSMWLDEIPAEVGFFLMLRITGADYEFESEIKLEVRLVAPDQDESTILKMGLSMSEMPPLKLPGMDPAMLLPTVMAWEATDYGLHTLDVFIDEHRQRTVAIYIRPASELKPEESETPEAE